MAEKLTKKDVLYAIQQELTWWRDRSVAAVDAYEFSGIPKDKAFLISSGWAAFGIDASQKLFPESFAGKFVGRASVQIWLLKFASSQLEKEWKKDVERFEKLVKKDVDRYKSSVINMLRNTELVATTEGYGKKLINTLVKLAENSSFDNPALANRIIRQTLTDAGAIVSDNNEIKTKIHDALGKINAILKDIYLGTQWAPNSARGGNKLKYSDQAKDFKKSDFKESMCRIPSDVAAKMGPGEQIGYVRAAVLSQRIGRQPGLSLMMPNPPGDQFKVLETTGKNNKVFKAILADVWRYRTRHLSGLIGCNHTWIWREGNPISPMESTTIYKKSMANVESTYKRLYDYLQQHGKLPPPKPPKVI